MKRKYGEDSCDSSDTCEPKKRKKNQLGTKRKIVKEHRKSKKKKKSRKATERLSNRKGREKDVVYTALIRLDNDSRIPAVLRRLLPSKTKCKKPVVSHLAKTFNLTIFTMI